MSNLRQAAQRALKAMEDGEYRADMIEFSDALIALRAALAEPQTTHWEGCEAVHPECKTTTRKPLTDEKVWNTYKNLWMFHPAEEPRLAGDVLKFARAIERAHGIGEQHE